jgi:hypothetical protein
MQAEIPDGYASLQKEPHQRGSGGAEGGRWTHLGWPSRSIRPRPHDARVTVGALAQAVNGPNHTRRWERAGWGRRATVPVPGAQWRTVSNRVADSEGKARSRVLNGGDNRGHGWPAGQTKTPPPLGSAPRCGCNHFAEARNDRVTGRRYSSTVSPRIDPPRYFAGF